MIARVIVDVAAKMTDRPFDYLVPPLMQEWIEIGSRVAVPFGPRLIQGFVIGFPDNTDTDPQKLRQIDHVLDIQPPLNEELVKLANWMSRTYLCPEIVALSAMLPAALKAKYDRVLSLADDVKPIHPSQWSDNQATIMRIVKEKGSMTWDALLRDVPHGAKDMKRLVQEGLLIERKLVKDRIGQKRIMTIYPPQETGKLVQALQEMPQRAFRQREFLQYMLDHPDPIPLSAAVKQLKISAAAVKAMAEKGYLTIAEEKVLRDPYKDRIFERTQPLALTAEQQSVFAPIREAVMDRSNHAFLLHGVTGSGKTEIYLQAIAICLSIGREAIVLVPEIALTPQMVERFKGRFGDLVAVMHSRLSPGERYDEWRKIQLKQASVAVGARSAVFAPFTNIGLLIIDEEHETSYKQEDSPKYHTRDVALQRAEMHGATLLLGSATPSLETYRRAVQPTAHEMPIVRLALDTRVANRPLPPVRLIDMREELRTGNRSMFSRPLFEAITDRLAKQEQMILLLNRRGYSTFVMCRSCGYVCQCPHCDISLTYHRHAKTLRCHYCGYAEREVQQCPQCESAHIRYFGTGTQRVEEELVRLFPGIRVIRMDVDTTSEKGSHEKWLTMFQEHRADVLLGTQMVAKGLDFPKVTLVGVIAADSVLRIPDFRAAERTFQLLTQVAGRAGRHELPGEVVVQTYTPEHYSIMSAGEHDYAAFIANELPQRSQLGYPPYCRLILITLSHERLPQVIRAGELLAKRINLLWASRQSRYHNYEPGDAGQLTVLGPVASPIPRLKDRYRFQCMVKYMGDIPVPRIVRHAIEEAEKQAESGLQISVDVDPYMLM